MNNNAIIYVADYRGLVGSAIVRKLKAMGYTKIIKRNSKGYKGYILGSKHIINNKRFLERSICQIT